MKNVFFYALMILASITTSCSEDEPAMPANTVNFSTSVLGIEEGDMSKSFTIAIDRAADRATTVSIALTEAGVAVGTDYTTQPFSENGTLIVTIPAGSTTTEVAVIKNKDAFFDGDETINFKINTISEGITLGAVTNLNLSFSSIISEGSQLTLNGGEGGSKAANTVFVDLSNNEQTSVARNSWNLGFYCGTENAVILNNTTISSAIEANIELNAIVNSTDSATYAAALKISTSSEAFELIDDLQKDLSKNVIELGKVYLVSFGEAALPLYKVKVEMDANGDYKLSYAKIDESEVRVLSVTKDASRHFVYASLNSHAVFVAEPKIAKWDIQFTRAIYQTNMGTGLVPYTFSDLILLNSYDGVQAAEVLTATKAYDNFTLADAAAITFSSSVEAVGSKWRIGGGPTTQPSVKSDRFYLIKDAGENLYKLQFVSMGPGDGGTRGYPVLKYALLK